MKRSRQFWPRALKTRRRKEIDLPTVVGVSLSATSAAFILKMSASISRENLEEILVNASKDKASHDLHYRRDSLFTAGFPRADFFWKVISANTFRGYVSPFQRCIFWRDLTRMSKYFSCDKILRRLGTYRHFISDQASGEWIELVTFPCMLVRRSHHKFISAAITYRN